WMCDYGRLNYKWIGREDRLTEIQGSKFQARALEAAVQTSKFKPQSSGSQVSSTGFQVTSLSPSRGWQPESKLQGQLRQVAAGSEWAAAISQISAVLNK